MRSLNYDITIIKVVYGLTNMLFFHRYSLTSFSLCLLKWKREAAKAASTCVSLNTFNISFSDPHPPEAITGIFILSQIALINSISYPFSVPSVSMLVNSISPAPSLFYFFCPFDRINISVDFLPPICLDFKPIIFSHLWKKYFYHLVS